MKKRILSFVLILCMAVSLFGPLSVTAATISSGTCGSNLTWVFDDTGTLTISGTGKMTDWSSGYAPWHNLYNIRKVLISNGVTGIGEGAFGYCSYLTSITIPSSVTGIGNGAFYGCCSLTSITIPNSVTGIGDSAFYGCSSLTSVTISNSVTSIGYRAFYECRSLTNITIPSSVTGIGNGAFYGCCSLTSITIPNSVTSIGADAFYGCSSMTSITIPNGVSSIEGGAFSNCTRLTSITIPNSVTIIWYNAFSGCSVLENVYYKGTSSDWSSISIVSGNEKLTNANIHYLVDDTTFTTSATDSWNYTYGGEYHYWKMIPSQTATYVFESTLSSGNSYGYLYDSKFNEITKNDNGGNGNNFKITYDLTAGTTYYYGVRWYGTSTTGTIPVKLTKEASVTNYTVTYNYSQNGGLSATKTSASIASGSNADLTVTATKSGWDFVGWNTDPNATTALSSYTVNANVTLYAIYKKTLTASFYSGNNSLQTSKTVTIYNNETSGTITASTPSSYGGWTILGWRDDTTADDYEYSSTANITLLANTSYYAVYRRTLTLSYNANGGSSVPSSQTATQYYNASGNKQNKTFTLANAITRSGYNFNKWAKDSASGTTYSAGSSITISDNTTMYATWNTLQMYTISYLANGGTGAPSSQTKEKGNSVTLSTTKPTYFPKTFMGWATSSSASSASYMPGDTYSTDSNLSLYAVWSDATTLSTSLPTTSSGNIAVGGTYRYYKFTPSVSGTYVFESTLSNGDTYGYLYNSSGTQLTSNDDGGDANGNTRNFKIEYDLTAGTTYYYGVKWYSSSNTGSISVKLSKIIRNSYTVTFDANGGTGTPSSQVKEEDVPLTLSSYKPSKSYVLQYNASGGNVTPASKNVTCSFNSWNTKKNGSGNTYSPGAIYNSNNDVTLYAQWTDPLAGTLAVPSRSGYNFVGWFTSSNGGLQITESSTITGNLTLYAHWEDPYNMGDETYSFDNYGDSDSWGGHCFGMSITSAGYHIGSLDIRKIGGNSDTSLYSMGKTQIVKQPICYYQSIQGRPSQNATVAGGNFYLYGYYNIASDWQEVVNYVKNHNYDNTGLLQIGFRKKDEGGHAINFLRYENVNGQDRIYAYDNNFPNVETYFYRNSSGYVLQAPMATFSGAIDCIALRDCRTYFNSVKDFDSTHVLYMPKDAAVVQGYTYSYMEGEFADEEYVIYEIPANQDRVIIIPKRDYADFIYMDTEYSFGKITDETRGEFRFATLKENAINKEAYFRIYETDLDDQDEMEFEITDLIPSFSSYQQHLFGSVTATVNNRTADTKTVTVLLGVYDRSEKLISCDKKEFTFNAGNNNITFNNLFLADAANKECYVKCFIWDENLKPLSQTISVALDK